MSEQIQQMQRLQLAGTLASGIAHDLNNQLTLVLGNLEVAMDHLPAGYDAHGSLALAKTAASRCADMSRRLLYLGRESRNVMARMDVVEAVREAQLMLECIKPPKIRISAACEEDLFMLGDATQIQQVLINLGTNAYRAMPKGGDLEIQAYLKCRRVYLTVRDTGCGIPASLRKRIFEPFFTTHQDEGGSGLGLATVKIIVDNHGGAIGVASTPGEGTKFELSFQACKTDFSLSTE
jgi:two-component system cell cycle sensor histidine kinase/response regulator CckA